MRNIVLFYHAPDDAVNCRIPLFFNSELEIHFDRFPKELALKLLFSILLKHAKSNLAIVFVNHNNLQNR